MARHISIRLSVDISINETDFALLSYLKSVTAASSLGTSVPARAIARELGVCMATVRRSVKTLVEQGLISCYSSHRSDGAQEGNRYAVTRLGCEVLAISGEVYKTKLISKQERDAEAIDKANAGLSANKKTNTRRESGAVL